MNLPTRPMIDTDRAAVAELICLSTNYWYQTHARPAIFSNEAAADVFFDTYSRLDPNCGLVVENPENSRIIGSCFYHPRATHVSLGIMNAHPNHAGKGVAQALLGEIIRIADRQNKPVRLVSSAMNLDSYSLYNRRGFVPRAVFQDMYLAVPAAGLPHEVAGAETVRAARPTDLAALAELDLALLGIRRDADYAFFLANEQNIWTTTVATNSQNEITGWLASNSHPGSGMIGPGVSVDESTALALLRHHLHRAAGRTPVFLVPATATKMVSTLYSWGARNCELHFQQVRGECPPIRGVHMPTFLPESA